MWRSSSTYGSGWDHPAAGAGVSLSLFFRYEVEHLLARCGFRIADLYGDFDRSPLGDTSPEMIFVAEKVEP